MDFCLGLVSGSSAMRSGNASVPFTCSMCDGGVCVVNVRSQSGPYIALNAAPHTAPHSAVSTRGAPACAEGYLGTNVRNRCIVLGYRTCSSEIAAFRHTI